MQKQAITPVENAARTLSRDDRLPQNQRDDLNNASMIQRQVTEPIQRPRRGPVGADPPHAGRPPQFQDGQARRPEADGGHAGRVDAVRDRNLGPAEQGIVHAVKGLEDQQSRAGPNAAPSPDRQQTTPPQGRERCPAASERGSGRRREETGCRPSGDSPRRNRPARLRAVRTLRQGDRQLQAHRPMLRRLRRRIARRKDREAARPGLEVFERRLARREDREVAGRDVEGRERRPARGIEGAGRSPATGTSPQGRPSGRARKGGAGPDSPGARRGEDEPEGDRRRAPEDAR